ncbi:Peptide methionine sulfoxide reductase [Mycena chlorophos]|uniref:Peptide methionine sulfoxide reductase n=1 Tax=Mycena chlorophos TaxID=658473 RepID=A0A8H6VZR1_MYCCL|nr:Peptide methionine sulfoxide reductase [Mycena chlorophos]
MSNATLYTDADADADAESTSARPVRRAVYTLSTQVLSRTGEYSIAELRSARDKRLVARITRRSIKADTVWFPTNDSDTEAAVEEQWKISKWMKRCKLSDGTYGHVINAEIGQCILRRHPEYRLALFTEFDSETPVAYWTHTTPSSSSKLPSLLISPLVPSSLHAQVVCAFLIEELKLRMRMPEDQEGSLRGKVLTQTTAWAANAA